MKTKTRQDKPAKPPSILKKSQSHKAVSNHLFDNQNIKQATQADKAGSVYANMQQTLKQQIKQLKRRENSSTMSNKQSYRELGHRLIEEIRELSGDDILLTKIVVEFMESMSSQNADDIVRHFRNTLNLIVRGMRASNKEKQALKQTKVRMQRKGSVKELVIHTKNLQDQLMDCSKQLQLYKSLLSEEKQLSRTYQSRLLKFQKSNGMLSKNQKSYQLSIAQLKESNKGLEEELSKKEAGWRRLKQQAGVIEEKLHCSKVENESLHEKNKSLEKELYEIKKQLNALRSNRETKLETLQRQNRDATIRCEELAIQNNSLKSSNAGLAKQIAQIREDKQHLELQLEATKHKLHQAATELETIQKSFKTTVQREAELDRRVELLEYQKLRLNTQLKGIYELNQPQPVPSLQRQPKSNKKLKALQEIQALIRRHKSTQ